jgi:DNA-binding beta-propeller fold protein YncE
VRIQVVDRRAFIAGAASLVLAPKALAQLGLDTEIALVTADLEARLVAVDLATGRIRRYVQTLPQPRSIETVGGTAVVAHSELGVITLVRGETLEIARVLRGFGEPRYTAGHPDGRHAYVTDAERGEVVVLDVLRGRVLGREQVGHLARHITIDPSGRRLWIALGKKAQEIAIVGIARPARPRLLGVIRPPFLAHDVGWTPDGARVWVSSGDREELAVYNPRTGKLVRRLAGDAPPQHVSFRGGRAYVTSGDSGTLRVHRVNGDALRTTAVPEGSYNVQQAHGWVVTPGMGRGRLCILDAAGRLVRRKQVARSSHDACILTTAR